MSSPWNYRHFLICSVFALAYMILAGWVFGLPAYARDARSPQAASLLINELDADNPGADSFELIELYDGGTGNTDLSGLVLVFYNGENDASYRALDLDGYATDERGYFVAGNPLVFNVDLTFPSGTLQNGPDAVALYLGEAADFPNGTPLRLQNLVDAVVYNTGQADDPGLQVLLNPGQPQVNENSRDSDLDSLQRCPDGSGGGRNTSTYRVYLPTPGLPNCRPILHKQAPPVVSPGERITYTLTVGNIFTTALSNLVISDAVPAGTSLAAVLDGGSYMDGVVHWNVALLPPATLLNPFQAQVQVRLAVTASITGGPAIVNDRYAVSAANFITPTFGASVRTIYEGSLTRIHAIQGAGHISPLNGQSVKGVVGMVTATRSDGFYLQDPQPDADLSTSEGIYVQMDGPHALSVGDAVVVDGMVAEYRPGGQSGQGNLTITQIIHPVVRKVSSGNLPPAPVILGTGGRIPPGEVIEDDAAGDVETSGAFDPESDGMDFYESLEGMLAQVSNPIAAGPTDASVGENFLLPELGARAGVLTGRGGVVVREGDFNPERLIVDDALQPNEPVVRTGAVFSGTLLGVIDYSRYNYKLLNLTPFPVASGGVISETTTLTRSAESLFVATLNLENLSPSDPQIKYDRLAREIVTNLGAPDLLVVEEVQDNSGTEDDGMVAADQTWGKLIAAIQAAGGPVYTYREVEPQNNQDGGAFGGNIRQGFLFREDRGLAFVDRPGATATTANLANLGAGGIQLAFSPGRIDPADPAFMDSRKPLAGEFTFYGQKIILIACHFNSKQGDDPLFGRNQPPAFASEARRIAQAQIVNDFVDGILRLDPLAKVIVSGDLNDFPFSSAVQALEGGALTGLVARLPAGEQYTYIYEGNSQAIDHILASEGIMAGGGAAVDIVHMNAEFPKSERPTDHDPVLARFTFPLLLRRVYLPLAVR